MVVEIDIPDKWMKYVTDKNGDLVLFARRLNGHCMKHVKVAMDQSEGNADNLREIAHALSRQDVSYAVRSMNKQMQGVSGNVKAFQDSIDFVKNGVGALSSLSFLNVALSAAGIAVNLKEFHDIKAQLAVMQQSLEEVKSMLSDLKEVEEVKEITLYGKVLGNYSGLLEKVRLGEKITREELRIIVQDTDLLVNELYTLLMKGLLEDKESLLSCIFNLLPVYTDLLVRYDTVYREQPNASGWDLDHDKWMKVFQDLSSEAFLNKFNVYSFIDCRCSHREATSAVRSLQYILAKDMEQVNDNQALLALLGSKEKLDELDQDLSLSADEQIINMIASQQQHQVMYA